MVKRILDVTQNYLQFNAISTKWHSSQKQKKQTLYALLEDP